MTRPEPKNLGTSDVLAALDQLSIVVDPTDIDALSIYLNAISVERGRRTTAAAVMQSHDDDVPADSLRSDAKCFWNP